MFSRAADRSRRTMLLFAIFVLVGWTALAAGVIAAFEGEPIVSMQTHSHEKTVPPDEVGGPMLSDCPDGPSNQEGLDGSVPCSA